MAVYRRTYQRYDGALTPEWSRFFVLTRYAYEEMRRSRILTVFVLLNLLIPVFFALTIYLHHNLSAIQVLKLDVNKLMPIDARFFMTFLGLQCMFAFLLTAFVGPGLVSPDLANNAMPLYLARPFSRAEYILGKFAVLFIWLSMMTWVAGLLLYGFKAMLDPGWLPGTGRIAAGLFFGSLIWIVLLSLMALAISAWVKWKPVAGALMMGVVFVSAGFGSAINAILRTTWGDLINIQQLMGTVWVHLFEEPVRRGPGAVFFRVRTGHDLSVSAAWFGLLGICAFCLWMLHKRVRGVEVVR